MSSPKIALHKKTQSMEKEDKTVYKKRTQKDYSLSLKLQVVKGIEQGKLSRKAAQLQYGIQSLSTITAWLRKYSNFDWENQNPNDMPKTPEQKLMELEQEVLLLKKQKAFLEKQVEQSDKKVILFDMMITIAEEELNIPIRKKFKPE